MAVGPIEPAKWDLWNGQLGTTLGYLSELRVWTWMRGRTPSWLAHLRTHRSEMTSYLQANADALPNYEARYRAGEAISTGFAEIRREPDHCHADDQAATDAMEPPHGTAVSQRARGRTERHARGDVSLVACQL
jgi:hypothetical protein